MKSGEEHLITIESTKAIWGSKDGYIWGHEELRGKQNIMDGVMEVNCEKPTLFIQ